MENIIFSTTHAKQLIDTKQIEAVKTYIKQFFFKSGTHIFFYNGSIFTCYEHEKAVKLIPKDLNTSTLVPNEYTKKFENQIFSVRTYIMESEFMSIDYTPTISFMQPHLFIKKSTIKGYEVNKHFMNMAKPLNESLTTIPSNRTTNVEKCLKIVYDHIYEVLCSSSDVLFEYVLNFICASFFGRKLRKALLMQSNERTGKGQILNGLLNSILGERMYKTNSVETIILYSKPFEGCCLLNFDELPHSENFKGLQDSLKGLITEPTFSCRDMHSPAYTQLNTFNIIISSNNDCIGLSQTNNARYVVLDISEHRIGDMQYFKKLTEALNNDDVKRAFYEDMKTRFSTLDEWNEDIIPETITRNSKLIDALPTLYKYIKEQFILKDIDLNARTDQFLEEYRIATKDRTSNNKLGRYLTSLGIKPIKMSKNAGYKYKMSAKELYKIFDERKWIDNTIDFINPEDTGKKSMTEDAATFDESFRTEYDEAKKRIQELEQQVQILQEQITTKQMKICVKQNDTHESEYKVKYEDALARAEACENEMKKMIYPPVSTDEVDEFLDMMGGI